MNKLNNNKIDKIVFISHNLVSEPTCTDHYPFLNTLGHNKKSKMLLFEFYKRWYNNEN